MKFEILYLAWNRLAFTETTFQTMLDNTDWDLVNRLVVLDDTSSDGTFEYLQEVVEKVPVEVFLDRKEFRSPVMMMNQYLRFSKSDWFCKIDSDIMLPPGWLPTMLGVLERNPEVELLGMEAGMGGPLNPPDWDGVYTWEPSSHIGGVGLMKAEKFRKCGEIGAHGRYGFTEYQGRHRFVRGWITPSLPVACLDRVPIEPWVSLSEEYVEKNWQRPWGKYDPLWPIWWEWFTPEPRCTCGAGNGDTGGLCHTFDCPRSATSISLDQIDLPGEAA